MVIKNRNAVSFDMDKIDVEEIRKVISYLKNVNVLVIGDTIIDEYVYVDLKGRAIKDPILSAGFRYEDRYLGGIIATANHISTFVDSLKVVTLLGEIDSKESFIVQNLADNSKLKPFFRKGSRTTVKRRYIDHGRNNKLFKVEYMDDKPLPDKLTSEIVAYLKTELPKYDLVVVSDFGHGFLNDEIRSVIEAKSRFLAVNVQANSANYGFNLFTKYNRADYITMNETELRLPFRLRYSHVDDLIAQMDSLVPFKNFLVTMGKNGCKYVTESSIYSCPAMVTATKDTVGAGDALFAISLLFVYANSNPNHVPFIANCAGGLLTQIMGNEKSVTIESLNSFIKEVMKNGMERL